MYLETLYIVYAIYNLININKQLRKPEIHEFNFHIFFIALINRKNDRFKFGKPVKPVHSQKKVLSARKSPN